MEPRTPPTNSVGARRFNYDLILPVDILLTTTPDPVSAPVRTAARSDISQAMLCVKDGSVIDSTDEGAQARNLRRFVIELGGTAYALRPAQALMPEQLWTVIAFARSHVGTRYTNVEAARAVLKGGTAGPRQFCSRLVAQAYREVGVQLVHDPRPTSLLWGHCGIITR